MGEIYKPYINSLPMRPIISSGELRKMNEAIEKGLADVEISLDLGLTAEKVRLQRNGFRANGKVVKTVKIREDDNSCYVIIGGKLEKVQFFSPKTKFLYKLVPTESRPILQISGTSMHKRSFIERIENDKLAGKVLDSGTGLGYTAIAASKAAKEVITVEIDKNVLEIARLNPYSQGLFSKKNIKSIVGNIVDKIKEFKDGEFDCIIFDAGTPKSSGEFFSLNNYKQAYRVLKKGGKLYHYLPRHNILRGRDFGAEAIKRLKKAGFSAIERSTYGSYAVAQKAF
jgi:hypothetical protein